MFPVCLEMFGLPGLPGVPRTPGVTGAPGAPGDPRKGGTGGKRGRRPPRRSGASSVVSFGKSESKSFVPTCRRITLGRYPSEAPENSAVSLIVAPGCPSL